MAAFSALCICVCFMVMINYKIPVSYNTNAINIIIIIIIGWAGAPVSSCCPGSPQVIGGIPRPITIRLQSGLVDSLDMFFVEVTFGELSKFTTSDRVSLVPCRVWFSICLCELAALGNT